MAIIGVAEPPLRLKLDDSYCLQRMAAVGARRPFAIALANDRNLALS